MKIKGKNVFLSGPMSGLPAHNVGAFAEAHHRLRELGAEMVYDPAVRYLEQAPGLDGEMGHGDYVARCVNALTDYSFGEWDDPPSFSLRWDVVVQLPGWERSEGARVEAEVARACGIPCVALADVS